MSFQLHGLKLEPFGALFALSDEELAARNIERVVATESPGYPCRVSLIDAAIGERLLLLPYEHQPANSPYRSSGPVFVRENAQPARLGRGEITDYVKRRLISFRAYDATDHMIDAVVAEGERAGEVIMALFDRREVAYLHLHNAKRGCYSCRVDRA